VAVRVRRGRLRPARRHRLLLPLHDRRPRQLADRAGLRARRLRPRADRDQHEGAAGRARDRAAPAERLSGGDPRHSGVKVVDEYAAAAVLLVAGAAMGFVNNLAGAGGVLGLLAFDFAAGLSPSIANASMRPAALSIAAAGAVGFASRRQ